MGNPLKPAAALLLVALALMLPSFALGPSALDSGPYNYAWTLQFADALGRGELYPRWMPDSFLGLGSPTFFFYPPLTFYVTGLIHLAGVPTWQSINVAGVLFAWASGMTMWMWLKRKSARPVLWACLYMAGSYHVADFYVRAALAEFAAYAWLPLIAMGLEKRPRLLALAFAGLICTHLPMAVLAAVFLIGPLAAAKLMRREPIGADIVAGLTAVALSAIYLLPALTLQRHVSIEALWIPDFQPRGMSIWAGNVPPVHVATAAGVFVLAATAAWSPGRPPHALGWAGMAMVWAAASVGVAPWLWAAPVLENVQFPYRLLAIAEFAVVTAVALSPEPRSLLKSTLGLGIFAWTFAWSLNVGMAGKMLLADTSGYRAYIERELPDAPEYLPAGAAPRVLNMRTRYPDVGRFLPADRFNFPIWRVVRQGRAEPVSGPTIPVGATVTRRLLPVEAIGAAVSALGATFLLGWSYLGPRRPRKPAEAG